MSAVRTLRPGAPGEDGGLPRPVFHQGPTPLPTNAPGGAEGRSASVAEVITPVSAPGAPTSGGSGGVRPGSSVAPDAAFPRQPQGLRATLFQHPLDSLRPEEISAAVQAIRERYGKDLRNSTSVRFIEVGLLEPHPSLIPLLPEPGQALPPRPMPVERRARALTYDTESNMTTEWIVRLTVRQAGRTSRSKAAEATVLMSTNIKDVQPSLDAFEYEEAERVVKEDKRFIHAMARRGVTEMDLVMVDPWCVGYFSEADGPSMRLARALIFVRTMGGPRTDAQEDSELCDNGYAVPVEGLEVRVDLQNMAVIRVDDRELIPLSRPDPLRNYVNSSGDTVEDTGPHVRGLTELSISQPKGPSWTVEGNQVMWQSWRFRVGFNAREGLVLHNVSIFDSDSGRLRPVARRFSYAEMVVPYGDPMDPHYRKNAFDAGEDGLGKNAHSLELGCDCVGVVHYFDGHLVSYQGSAVKIPNAICMHEEDDGILWKHKDWRTGHTASKRQRRLVVSFFTTVANYEYGFFWYFYRDGKIETEIKLTGILSTGICERGKPRKYGTLLDGSQLYAPIHQHCFIARLHMAVDSDGLSGNRVVELNAERETKGPHNPHNNAFFFKEDVLESEQKAIRNMCLETNRHWEVRSCTERNRSGTHTAWRLVPGANSPLYAQEGAMFLRRASFLKNHLWVTPFNPTENFPGGDYPNQSNSVGDGLEFWTSGDRSLEDTGLVLWYNFIVTHLPRMEDWPVMPCEKIGFMMQPVNFFSRNPTVGPVVDSDIIRASSLPPDASPADLPPPPVGMQASEAVGGEGEGEERAAMAGVGEAPPRARM